MKVQIYFKVSILLLTVFHIPVNAQQVDTTSVNHIKALESQIDSLCRTIRLMDKELQQVKQNTVEGSSDVDELIALLNNDDVESVSVESRSRRKRVDALLKAITQRPGQLSFNGGATTILQNGSGDDSSRTTAVGSFDIYAHTAFGENTLLFIDLEAIGGNGPDVFFPTFSGLNEDAGSTQDEDGIDRLTVLEAWAEFTPLNKIITVTAGKIDLTNYFDNNASANDETMQFISGAFVNNAAFAVPGNAPGLRLRSTLYNRIHLQLGISSVNNSGRDISKEIYRIASIGYTLSPGSDYEANLRFYGYQHPLADNSTGWGISFDNVVFSTYNIFARYGNNNSKVAEYWGVQSSWSAGARFVRQIAGHSTALGLAYGENTSFRKNLKDEKIMEIYARRQLNEWTFISPHLQFVWNGSGTSDPVMIFGIRTHFNF